MINKPNCAERNEEVKKTQPNTKQAKKKFQDNLPVQPQSPAKNVTIKIKTEIVSPIAVISIN